MALLAIDRSTANRALVPKTYNTRSIRADMLAAPALPLLSLLLLQILLTRLHKVITRKQNAFPMTAKPFFLFPQKRVPTLISTPAFALTRNQILLTPPL